MVGEVRDGDTANIAVQAALTGHLLLSSLHTNDAPTAVPRLIDLGVPPFLVASTLNLIIAQRLVRKICPSCIYSYSPDAEFEKSVRDQFEHLGLPPESYKLPKVLYRGRGCKSCGGIGYRGRTGIFEILEISDSIKRSIISPQFTLEGLKTEARKTGMETMFEDGLKKVELAVTTIEEVLRVTQE
jgi:type II secretory ATPase GspE/PulE/Tfp pilus assembly ATPase PilB-like protein